MEFAGVLKAPSTSWLVLVPIQAHMGRSILRVDRACAIACAMAPPMSSEHKTTYDRYQVYDVNMHEYHMVLLQ